MPPGLALPPNLPATISRPPSTVTQSRHILPVLPKAPPPGLTQGTVTPEQSPRKTPATPGSEAKKSIKALAVESGLSKEISAQSGKDGTLQDEDFPALDALKASKDWPAASLTPKSTPKAKRQAEKVAERLLEKEKEREREREREREKESEAVKEKEPLGRDIPSSQRPAKATEKKPIAVNTQLARAVASKTGEHSASTEKSAADSAAFPPLPAPSAAASPATRAAPKTLRVIATPKTEIPPQSSPVPTLASVAFSAASRAVSISHRPETPASEMVSDSASIVSASVTHSRANSPPPTKVGAAAVRTTTKSQQRKQRKDHMKQETKMIVEESKPEPEEHAPVVGRKKKQKKEKPSKASAVQSRAATPALEPEPEHEESDEPKPKPEVPDLVQEQPPAVIKVVEKEKEKEKQKEDKVEGSPVKGKTAQLKKSSKSKGKEKEKETEKEASVTSTPRSTSPPNAESSHLQVVESSEKPQPGPLSIFNDIKKSLWTPSIDKLHMLKPITGGTSRTDYSGNNPSKPGHCKDCSCKCGEIQDDDLAALRAGKPVRKQFHVDGSRMLITPNGDCIRGLTPEEEDAFLELQAAIAVTAENPGAFIAPRHQPGSGAFSLIKGRAVPNGRPNIFPASSQPQSQDPIGKLQREDALSYINQYVLPRLNLGATNMGFPKGASPTKDAAAASLNSLAPYFYGPDAAAGVGIYSPPDGPRSMQEFGSTSAQSEEGGKNVGMGVGGMPLMSVEDAEGALAAARRETEKLEKGLNQVIRRNRRLLLGNN